MVHKTQNSTQNDNILAGDENSKDFNISQKNNQINLSTLSESIQNQSETSSLDMSQSTDLENTTTLVVPPLSANIPPQSIQNTEITEKTKPVVNDTKPTELSSSIMLQANDDESKNWKKETIDLNRIEKTINKKMEQEEKELDLGESWLWLEMIWRKFELSYWKIFITSFVVIVFSWVIAAGFFAYIKYIKLAVEPVLYPPYDEYVEKYQNYEKKIQNIVSIGNYKKYSGLSISGPWWEENLNKIIDAEDLSYIHKKNIIQEEIDGISNDILKNFQQLSSLRQDITKYGLLSKEVYSLMEVQEETVSIKQSLLSLEVIKFSSAMRVFSFLDTFLEWLSTAMPGLSPESVAENMQNMITRWEKDIYLYLNNCYLNPYERNYECDSISDFDKYYHVLEPDVNFDKVFFKQLIKYIDLKLEQTEIPSFSIIFKKFNQSQKQISFSIDVNTFQQDEIALAEKNIINPHIFIVTQLLNLLKQSTFIIWETIDIRNLKVEPKLVSIWENQFTINNSQMSFNLPIQKNTQREIYDFAEWLENIDLWTKIITQAWTTIDSEDKKEHSSPIEEEVDFDAYETAKALLNWLKNQDSIQNDIDIRWEAIVLSERVKVIRDLEQVNKYLWSQIVQVVKYIQDNQEIQNKLTKASDLVVIWEDWESLFQTILNESNESK